MRHSGFNMGWIGLIVLSTLWGCGASDGAQPDGGQLDANPLDATPLDATPLDATQADAAQTDAMLAIDTAVPGVLGDSCGAARDCESAFCVDGVCCESLCEGLCVACGAADTGALDGQCAPVRDGDDPASECDATECGAGVCDGSGACGIAASGTVCRASAGGCDVPEVCDGVDETCPADVLLPAEEPCRASAGPCDVAESCSGRDGACPADQFATSGVCRSAAGACDVDDSCDGSGATCPADDLAPASTPCRSAVGACDAAEVCTGTSAACPVDGVAPSTQVCRPTAGVCDTAERCTGTTTTCPANTFMANTSECRQSLGACDLAEFCSGSGAACPGDTLRQAGFPCRPSAGVCDQAETCSGVSVTCAADAFRDTSVVCRPSTAVCDATEFCPGTSAACPADAAEPGSSLVCAPYTCGAGGCRSSCTTNADCAWDGATACVAGACVRGRAVFVGSTELPTGAFGGLSVADDLCTSLAASVGFTGTFKAWLSDETTSASARLIHSTVPYVMRVANAPNVTIANNWSDLTDGTLLSTLVRNQIGAVRMGVMFTGTQPTGALTPTFTCSNWTASAPARYTAGLNSSMASAWSNTGNIACDVPGRFYCLEQTVGP